MAKAAVHEVVTKKVVLEITEAQGQVIAALLANVADNPAQTIEVYNALSRAGVLNWDVQVRLGPHNDYIDSLQIIGLPA